MASPHGMIQGDFYWQVGCGDTAEVIHAGFVKLHRVWGGPAMILFAACAAETTPKRLTHGAQSAAMGGTCGSQLSVVAGT